MEPLSQCRFTGTWSIRVHHNLSNGHKLKNHSHSNDRREKTRRNEGTYKSVEIGRETMSMNLDFGLIHGSGGRNHAPISHLSRPIMDGELRRRSEHVHNISYHFSHHQWLQRPRHWRSSCDWWMVVVACRSSF